MGDATIIAFIVVRKHVKVIVWEDAEYLVAVPAKIFVHILVRAGVATIVILLVLGVVQVAVKTHVLENVQVLAQVQQRGIVQPVRESA